MIDRSVFELAEKIEAAVALDPGGRGFVGPDTAGHTAKAVELLAGADTLLILTGFPIPAAGAGENDGPVGAAAIALAAERTGRKWRIMTDKYSDKIAAACLRALGLDDSKVISVSTHSEGVAEAKGWAPDLIISIERPGRAADGHCRGMRGAVLDDMTVDLSPLLALGVPCIAVGDGGNELGMGNFAAHTAAHVSLGGLVAATDGCDAPLTAGISNWWGWGLAAIMGALKGVDTMTTPRQERDMLIAVMEAGGVDGVLARPGLSVDGVELGGPDIHDEIYRLLKEHI